MLAYASHCHNDENSGRPYTGLVVLNINSIKLNKNQVRFTFEDIFHEIVHVIGFSSSLFSLFKHQPAFKKEI